MKKKIAVLFPGIGYTCDKPLLYLLHLPEGINSQQRIFYLHHFSRHFYLQMGMGLYFMERQTRGLIQKILQKDVKS